MLDVLLPSTPYPARENRWCTVRLVTDQFRHAARPLSTPIVLAGDVNVRLDRPTDSAAKRFTDLLDSLEMMQHMTRTTHTHDGILDVVSPGWTTARPRCLSPRSDFQTTTW